MKKNLFLQALLLLFYAASSQAADMSCLASWERDHSMNYEKCVTRQNEQIQAAKQVESKVAYSSSCTRKWERDPSANYNECASDNVAGL